PRPERAGRGHGLGGAGAARVRSATDGAAVSPGRGAAGPPPGRRPRSPRAGPAAACGTMRRPAGRRRRARRSRRR
ncbi:MAG: hypothetical protein ACK559_27575, partial [bacterium]